MNTIKITFNKYKELHNAVNDRSLGTPIGWLEEHYKCRMATGSRYSGLYDIVLVFDNEQDCMWFQLKHL